MSKLLRKDGMLFILNASMYAILKSLNFEPLLHAIVVFFLIVLMAISLVVVDHHFSKSNVIRIRSKTFVNVPGLALAIMFMGAYSANRIYSDWSDFLYIVVFFIFQVLLSVYGNKIRNWFFPKAR